MIVKIYELRDPRDETKSPRYVGITTKDLKIRLNSHLNGVKYDKTRINHKVNWIKNLLKNNIIPSIHLIEEVEGWDYACEVEKYWIKEFKEQGYKLTNSTDGGEGVLGFKHSQESIDRMAIKVSKANKGRIPNNYEYMKNIQKRAVLEYENNIFIREYESCKEAGKILNIDYKLINNILRKKVKATKKYPNKIWIYKDGLGIRKQIKSGKYAKKNMGI